MKIKSLLANIVVVAITAVAILCYFLFPLWSVKAKFTFTQEVSDLIIDTAHLREKEGSEEGSEDLDKNGLIIEVLDSFVENEVGFSLDIKFQTLDIITSVISPRTDLIEKLVESNVDSVMAELSGAIDKAVEPIVSAVVKSAVKQQVKDQLLNSGASYGELDEVLEDIGFNDEFVEENVSAVLSALMDENATVDSVAEAVVAVVDSVVNLLKDSKQYGENVQSLTVEDKAEIKTAIGELLGTFTTDGKNINYNDFINTLLLGMLRSENNGESASIGLGTIYAYADEQTPPEEGPSSSDASEEVKAELRALIMNVFSGSTISAMLLAMQVIGGITIVAMLSWAWLIVKLLFKLFAKVPMIKLALPIWCGWLPALILVYIPMIVMHVIGGGSAPLPDGGALLPTILGAVKISFSSGAVYASICALALWIYSGIYAPMRKSMKKQLKKKK